MKSKIFKILLISLVIVLLLGSVSASATAPYTTYTYSIDGLMLESPHAYEAESQAFTETELKLDAYGIDFGQTMLSYTDIFADTYGRLYISDATNGQIIVTNSALNGCEAIIKSYKDEFGIERSFIAPQGLFVIDPETSTVDKELPEEERDYLYVCDYDASDGTGANNKIVVFNSSFEYVRTISCPTNAPALISSERFKPIALAVDMYGRIFVISSGSYQGVIGMSHEGDFTGYIGAQKVAYNFFEEIWENFQTDEQKQTQIKNLSYAFNNIAIDSEGFIYVTTDNVDEKQQFDAIKKKTADYSPVKKLNSTGDQIMKRNGFFDPGGEVDVFDSSDVSKLTDVALGRADTWTILDSSRNRFFTYDQNGNLLFAFGDTAVGSSGQIGNGSSIRAITYQVVDDVYYLVALDWTAGTGYTIIRYRPSEEYYPALMSALENEASHDYNASIEYWREVLRLNPNFDLAYIGIGKAYFSMGTTDPENYTLAYENLQIAYETAYASKAFAEVREEFLANNLWWIAILVIALVVALFKYLGYAKKKNKETALKVGKRTFREEFRYAFHLIFHPFDGFWDLKHEKRGSVRAATVIFVINMIAFGYNTIGKGYLHAPRSTDANIFVPMLVVFLLVMLWSIANWCLTTLFEGEGSFKDIYIATCYSLTPLAPFVIISTVLTNIMTVEEGTMVSMLTTIGLIWAILLIFFGMMVTHDYSIKKNIVTSLGTILAMIVIIFIALLFANLVIQMVTFVLSIFTEVGTRL